MVVNPIENRRAATEMKTGLSVWRSRPVPPPPSNAGAGVLSPGLRRC